MYQLISATPSPYARKVRIALAEKGLPFELLTEVPWDSTTRTPRYNPLEKLPILLLDDGTSPEWLARQRRKIVGGMAEMARLVGQRQWAVGETFSLGDIAVGTAAGYVSLRYPDFQWRTPHPDLARFSDRLAQRQSFKDSVPVAQTITDKVV